MVIGSLLVTLTTKARSAIASPFTSIRIRYVEPLLLVLSGRSWRATPSNRPEPMEVNEPSPALVAFESMRLGSNRSPSKKSWMASRAHEVDSPTAW